MAVAVVVDQNNSYGAWENYANHVAVALDTENLDYCSDENVAPYQMMAYRMDCGAVVRLCDSPCHHYRVDKMVDYRTGRMTVATAGRVNVVTIYCCR